VRRSITVVRRKHIFESVEPIRVTVPPVLECDPLTRKNEVDPGRTVDSQLIGQRAYFIIGCQQHGVVRETERRGRVTKITGIDPATRPMHPEDVHRIALEKAVLV